MAFSGKRGIQLSSFGFAGFPQKAISSVLLSRFCSHSLVDPIWDRSNRVGSSAFSLYEFKRLERTPRIRAATAPSLALF